MNLKTYTLTTLCLFFLLKINAQNIDPVSSIDNEIDLTLLVEDGLQEQTFSLLADDYHNVFHAQDMITYKINLKYQSTAATTTYFRLKCTFEEVFYASPGLPASFLFRGTTAPVIIPPVKKKKRDNRRPIGIYPYAAEIIYRIHPKNYRVTIELLKYDNIDDYLEGNENYTVNERSKVIYLNATHDMPSQRALSATAFPNPSTDYLIIEHTTNTTNNSPLEVIIFNDKGVKVSQHTVTNSDIEATKASYNLDTSHLQNGTYYVQLSYEGKTQVKTIIKK
ncbi:T9SS type A sorting domain-containing protein [uncultured Kordia sp.]|uniref:T9SS type A sorting domain-containing protein n=1 Tax=uncultured Kordia sp. TaxID=507699 RepID=UPI0026365957|nr:T9SS type A sorting domain-containing protein [uncultured Kordia sp.]